MALPNARAGGNLLHFHLPSRQGEWQRVHTRARISAPGRCSRYVVGEWKTSSLILRYLVDSRVVESVESFYSELR